MQGNINVTHLPLVSVQTIMSWVEARVAWSSSEETAR